VTEADAIDLDARAERLLAQRRPNRRDEPRLAPQLAGAECRDVETGYGRVAAWRVGPGPAVLMVHGWDDDNSLWGPAIDACAAAGRAAVVLDLPGHGFSEAPDPHYRVAAAAVAAVARELGPVDALMTHSYGGAVSVAAMAAGLAVDRAVLIAATVPRRMPGFDPAAMPADARAVHDRAAAIYEARTGRPMAVYDVEAAVPRLTARALFVHSADDEYPAENARRLAALWPGADFEQVDGLGHRRVARDPAVLDRALRFLGTAR